MPRDIQSRLWPAGKDGSPTPLVLNGRSSGEDAVEGPSLGLSNTFLMTRLGCGVLSGDPRGEVSFWSPHRGHLMPTRHHRAVGPGCFTRPLHGSQFSPFPHLFGSASRGPAPLGQTHLLRCSMVPQGQLHALPHLCLQTLPTGPSGSPPTLPPLLLCRALQGQQPARGGMLLEGGCPSGEDAPRGRMLLEGGCTLACVF